MGLFGFGKKSASELPPLPPLPSGNPFDAVAYDENSPLTYAVRFARASGQDSTGPYELASVAKAFLEKGDSDRAIKTILKLSSPQEGLNLFYVGELFRLWIAQSPEMENRINSAAGLMTSEAVNPKPKWRSEPDLYARSHFFSGLACAWAEQERWEATTRILAHIANDNLRSLALSRIARISLKSQGPTAALEWFGQAKTVQYAGEFLEDLAMHPLNPETMDAIDRRLGSSPPVRARFLAALARRSFMRRSTIEAAQLWDRAAIIAEGEHPQGWELVKPLTDLLCIIRPLERTDREEPLLQRLLESCRAANDLSESKGGGPGWLSADAMVELSLNGREDLAARIAGHLASTSNYRSVVAVGAWEERLKADWLAQHAGTAPLQKIERILERLSERKNEERYCAALARRYEKENLPDKAASWWASLRQLFSENLPANVRSDVLGILTKHYLEADQPENVVELLAAYAPTGYDILNRYLIEADLAAWLFKHSQPEKAQQVLDGIRSHFLELQPAQNRSIAVQKVMLVLGEARFWEESLRIFDEVISQESDTEFRPCANRIGKELCLLLASQPEAWTEAVASRIGLLCQKLAGKGA